MNSSGKIKAMKTIRDVNGCEHDLEVTATFVDEKASANGPAFFEVTLLKVTEEIEGVVVNVTETLGYTHREELEEACAGAIEYSPYSNYIERDDKFDDTLLEN